MSEATGRFAHIVVTGCGRSGTGHIAAVLNALGIPCGHERAMRPQGFVGWGDLVCEASWFAPPFLDDLPEDTFIVHQVRRPEAVIASFHRIGFFADGPWRNVFVNPRRTASYLRYPGRLPRRLRELRAQRGVVARHTTVFDEPDELLRGYRYWTEWNQLVTESLTTSGRPHRLQRLEDLDATAVHEMLRQLDRPIPSLAAVEEAMASLTRTNEMREYRERVIEWIPFDRLEGMVEVVEAFGYNPLSIAVEPKRPLR